VSFTVTMTAAPLVLRVLLRRGVLDVPNHRSSHRTPVPRGGGVACLFGVLAGLLVASTLDHDVYWLAMSGAVFLAFVGFLDDRSSIAAAPRLGAQLAAGALIGGTVGGGWWILAGMICIPVAVNVVNFMDGINGITGLNVAAWGFVAMAVGYVHGEPSLVTKCLGFKVAAMPADARRAWGDRGRDYYVDHLSKESGSQALADLLQCAANGDTKL
jgi:UDP-N-acetylmuramyl pentapeptide phosphotransferase/UDP-N-acetylglucosamine-1-phosphate transferase